VTVTSPDAFGEQQPYAEQQTLYFPNKYKFLSFFEDHRPAYHGTWCKKSKVVTGRTPFGQDKKQLNYDEDSEAEWEEGDDELGEDLNDEAADGEDEDMDPEEGDTRAYNYADGWMAEDDDVIYEDEEVDDETRILRKKLKSTTLQLSEELVASINGVPLLEVVKKNASFDVSRFVHVCAENISGVTSNPLELEVLASEAEILCTDDICLDAFPPTLVDENFVGDPSQIGASAPKTSSTSSNQEMSTEDLKLFAIFVHHSTFPSKDRLVEELRQAHPKVTSSRAQATRKLDVIATKVKNPVGSGVIWEIKREVLQELGLKKQLAMKLPEPEQKKNVVLKDETQKKPTVKSSDRKESAATPVAAKKVAKSSSVEEKKRKPQVDPASAALLKNFVCVKKAKTD
jgi:chromatin assembly factor 1 subunit A